MNHLPLWRCPSCKIPHPEIFKFCPYCGFDKYGTSALTKNKICHDISTIRKKGVYNAESYEYGWNKCIDAIINVLNPDRDTKMIDALKASISYWEELVNKAKAGSIEDVDVRKGNLNLCEEAHQRFLHSPYRNRAADNNPNPKCHHCILVENGYCCSGCRMSPYYEIFDMNGVLIKEGLVEAIKKQLEFLKEVLRIETQTE